MNVFLLTFICKKAITIFQSKDNSILVKERTSYSEDNAQWESARPNLDLPKIEARSEVSA